MLALFRDWLPPIIFRKIEKNRRNRIRYCSGYASWYKASKDSIGYDSTDILEKVLDATLKVKRGEAAFERDSILFYQMEYVWPLISGLMWSAARNGGNLHVLDIGGALGSSYFQNRRFLDGMQSISWSVIEQVHYVDIGKEKIQDSRLRFYASIEECLVENKPNVILLSSVLQYLEEPMKIISGLSKVGADCLIIERTPFSSLNCDQIFVQKVPKSIYAASYPMWVFAEREFLDLLNRDWALVAQNFSPEGSVKTRDKSNFFFKGMLLEARQ
jgi:putative methyltransferase (TIGR04325 family)